jgi:Domain of Unknown Function (DUF1206)
MYVSMSMTGGVRVAASRAADNPLLEALARAGFVGYGITHLLLAWLALQVAFGQPAGASDQGGALHTLAGQPFGRILVVAIGIGLAAMAVWQALEAAVGHRADRGGERTAERIGSAGRTLMYAWLAWTAFQVVTAAKASSASQQQAKSAQLMGSQGGRWLVGAIGVGLVALGLGMIVYGMIRRFEKHLYVHRMSARTRRAARLLGVTGYTAKGLAYGIAGGLLVSAAVTYDPSKARGIDAALHALSQQPYGGLLLTLVAFGLAAFGIFCLVQARYRKV